MQKSPSIDEIKEWLIEENPLNLFKGGFSIKDIDQKEWSGHFNYLIEVQDKKFVLRFRGPEWGDTSGIANEFKILERLRQYAVGPHVHFLTNNFFGEPMFFEEYLEGKLLHDFSDDEQKKYFPEVAKYVLKINSIPFGPEDLPFQEPLNSYNRSRRSWKTRIDFIFNNKEANSYGQELLTLLPKMEVILERFEVLLQRVLKNTGDSFVFESAHLGHCILTPYGFRFFNWEKVSYGDPAYTLAVFLTSLHRKPNFEEIKDTMIKTYLEENPIPYLAELVEQRITERRISNIIWLIYTNAKLGQKFSPDWDKKIEELKGIVQTNN